MPKEFRRDKGVVRFMAFLDMMMSLILIVFYIGVVFATKTLVFNLPNGPFSKISLVIISILMWVIIFGVTYLQLSHAYALFLVTFQDALGPSAAVERSMSWLRVALFLLGFIAFKIIYTWLRFNSITWVFWVLCIMEVFFKLLGIYFVREFCDDMKHHIRLHLVTPSSKSSKSESKSKGDETLPKVVISNHTGSAVV